MILPIGKRACDRYRRGTMPVLPEDSSGEAAGRAGRGALPRFLAGEFDRVGILIPAYQSMMSQVPELRWILPLQAPERAPKTDMVFEPDETAILSAAVPAYVAGEITACVRESFASEVAARRNAMDSAGKNAREMIDDLQLQYNRARQGAITQEITEIVAGGNA